MPLVGSTITVDLHITEDTDLDSVQAVVRQNERADPDLSQTIRRAVEQTTTRAMEAQEIEAYDLSLGVDLVKGRVPGAPRERLTVDLDVEGDKSVVAAVDEAVSAPERAKIADEVEAGVLGHLREHDLARAVDVIVSVTPIQFR